MGHGAWGIHYFPLAPSASSAPLPPCPLPPTTALSAVAQSAYLAESPQEESVLRLLT